MVCHLCSSLVFWVLFLAGCNPGAREARVLTAESGCHSSWIRVLCLPHDVRQVVGRRFSPKDMDAAHPGPVARVGRIDRGCVGPKRANDCNVTRGLASWRPGRSRPGNRHLASTPPFRPCAEQRRRFRAVKDSYDPAIFPIGGAGREATQRGATRAKSKQPVAPKTRMVLWPGDGRDTGLLPGRC
jgi:hypothetical protein